MNLQCDADIFVFRCAFAAEYSTWHLKIGDTTTEYRYKKEAMNALDLEVPGKYSREEGKDYELWSERMLEPYSHAVNNLHTLVDNVARALESTEYDIKMKMSKGGETFRHRAAKTRPYKGNRDRVHRPTYEQELRQHIINSWDTEIAEDEEADDLMGIAQTRDNPNSVIVTLDKDLDQVPGLHYNWTNNRTYDITENQGLYNFHHQLLTGDSTDNIPGLPRVGPAGASSALAAYVDDPQEQLQEVWRMYQEKAPRDPWKYLHEMGQLLYIRKQVGEEWSVPDTFGFPEDDWTETALTLYEEEA